MAGYGPWDGEESDTTERLTLLPWAHCNHLGPILKSKGWAGPSLACSPFALCPQPPLTLSGCPSPGPSLLPAQQSIQLQVLWISSPRLVPSAPSPWLPPCRLPHDGAIAPRAVLPIAILPRLTI